MFKRFEIALFTLSNEQSDEMPCRAVPVTANYTSHMLYFGRVGVRRRQTTNQEKRKK